ncbi:probable crinkler effector protein 16 [Coccomyxa sp. Obi]|nr:probable crinkler effector protein 16 [Coccomyxa sp. Obi]
MPAILTGSKTPEVWPATRLGVQASKFVCVFIISAADSFIGKLAFTQSLSDCELPASHRVLPKAQRTSNSLNNSGMSTIDDIIDAWNLPQATAERLKSWLASSEGGWKLNAPPDEDFFKITNDDLKDAGFIALRDRKQILAKLGTQPGTQTGARVWHADLSKYWEELGKATVNKETNFMRLPTLPAEFRLFMPKLEHLYVRDCYRQLLNIVIDGTGQHTLVTGTPGIGKSCWQYYLLQHLASEGHTVVLDWAGADEAFLLCPEGAFVGSKTAFKAELMNPENFYLVDAKLPMGSEARTIETCSPMHSKQWVFVKERARKRIMPPWTLGELEAALPLFPAVSRERLHELYFMWGGSVRWALARANQSETANKESVALLEEAIGRSTLPALQRAVGVGGSDATQEVSSLLVHYIPDEDMIVSRVVMASQYVCDRVCETLLQNYKLDLLNFLTASTGDSALSVLRGNLFESFTHCLLKEGGQFKVRYLDTGMEEDVELPKASSYLFWDLSEVTMNLEHDPPEASVIRKCLQVLPAPAEKPRGPVYLTFAVPPDVFTNFKKLQIKGPLSNDKFPIMQRVMKIPLMRMRAPAFHPFAF